VLAVGIMAFVNPYGPENLIIPFSQLGEKAVTAEWVDWRPLIHTETIFSQGVFKPVSVIPFLIFLGISAGLLVFLVSTDGGVRYIPALMLGRTATIDTLMVVLIPVLLAPLVFRFQRMIIFAAPAMVPLVALLIDACAGAWAARFSATGGLKAEKSPLPPIFKGGKDLTQPLLNENHRTPPLCRGGNNLTPPLTKGGNNLTPPFSKGGQGGFSIRAVLAFTFLVLISLVFYRSVLVRHLSGNPLTYQEHDPPLLSRLMSRNFMRADAVRFLNDNHIKGRVFTNVYLSNYLLFHVPDIQVYFDLRVQSVFPEEIVKDYLSVVTPGAGHIEAAIDLLDRNRIDLVILDTSKSVNTWVADRLMETGRWGCIYADEWVIILAAASSPRFGPMIRTGNLAGLTYDRPETKTLARGLLSLFMRGSVEPDIVDRLIARVKVHPRPEVYSLIIGAMNGASPCLNSRTRTFLESEAERLAGSDYLVTGGAFSTLRSLLKILVILETNEIKCVANGRPQRFTGPRRAFMAAFDDVRRLYGGF